MTSFAAHRAWCNKLMQDVFALALPMMNITHHERINMNHLTTYQKDALRTEAPQPSVLARLGHAALGFVSESGEIATQVKRIAFYGKRLDSLDKDNKTLRVHIAEEVGDVMWYLAIAGDALGRDLFTPGMAGGILPRPISLHTATLGLSRAVGQFSEVVAVAEMSNTTAFSATDVFDISGILSWVSQCLVDIAHHIGTDLDTLAGENIEKLKLRYPNAFSVEAAEARADKGGLDARSS